MIGNSNDVSFFCWELNNWTRTERSLRWTVSYKAQGKEGVLPGSWCGRCSAYWRHSVRWEIWILKKRRYWGILRVNFITYGFMLDLDDRSVPWAWPWMVLISPSLPTWMGVSDQSEDCGAEARICKLTTRGPQHMTCSDTDHTYPYHQSFLYAAFPNTPHLFI